MFQPRIDSLLTSSGSRKQQWNRAEAETHLWSPAYWNLLRVARKRSTVFMDKIALCFNVVLYSVEFLLFVEEYLKVWISAR